MNEKQIKLAIGSMLHDVGKIVYRGGDGRNHSESGYEYLKNDAGIVDPEVLNCVRYHHSANLRRADLSEDSLAYITCFADNVAAAMDRRTCENPEDGFDKSVPLESVFNILNGNHSKMHYKQSLLDPTKEINVPTEEPQKMDDVFYQSVIRHITENLRGISFTEDYLNSLLTILEANTTYLPSSTSKRELADISLYDHLKMTAAIAACVEQVMAERGESNYQKILFDQAQMAYQEKWFLLYTMDVSGIQKFIYSVGTDGALKGLRSRSFYLELLMEHIIDELLEKVSLSRANLIYSGGGHCYLLLPNTAHVMEVADAWHKEVNHWLMGRFDTALYVACGYVECSAMELHNDPAGSYPLLFKTMSSMLSAEKAHRYDVDEILALNRKKEKGERECKICHRMEPLNQDDKCEICAVLENTSKEILYTDYFAITKRKTSKTLPLPGDCAMEAVTAEELKTQMQSPDYVRSYTKNQLFSGVHVTTKLLVGNYTTGMTFEQFAEAAEGIKRIAILRADVDNLGTAIVSGFPEQYASLSRTATFSRMLSLFFKGHINYLLANGKSSLLSNGEARNIAVVYSGGDDLFLVGAWNEVIDAFLDIKHELECFTEGRLTISGGIGLYPGKYPINLMAQETEILENLAKDVDGKNAVAVFDASGAYPWKVFEKDVLDEKYQTLQTFFKGQDERGMAFLYRLLELLRNPEEKIQFARYVYLLSRMEPDESTGKQEHFREFSERMVRWYQDPEERKKLITAIYLYVYRSRGRENA